MQEMEDAQARLDGLMAVAARAEALVEEWSVREFTGRADEGRIVAATDSLGGLLRLEISPLSRRRLGAQQLADAILTAIRTAEEEAVIAKEELLHDLRPGAHPSGRR
ncbi:hypothetical protein GCM10010404_06390 [Nonomuraea africana]